MERQDRNITLVTLTQEELGRIYEEAARIGAGEAIRHIAMERADRGRILESRKIKKTKRLLSAYRSMKLSESERDLTEAEKVEYRWEFLRDLMEGREEASELVIKDEEKRARENAYALRIIEQAVSMYRSECEKSGEMEGARGLRALEMMYILPEKYDVQRIAEVENVSKKTVYKDMGIACKGLAYYIFGL